MKYLNGIKERIHKKANAIEDRISELESRRDLLQNKLEREFDLQTEAELAGGTYDDRIIKSINSELQELSGRINAYRRKAAKPEEISQNDVGKILHEVAEEYKANVCSFLERRVRLYELQDQIVELMLEAKKIDSIPRTDDRPGKELLESGLFPGSTEQELRNIVHATAGLSDDPHYIELNNILEKYREKYPAHMRGWVWKDTVLPNDNRLPMLNGKAYKSI